MNLLERLNFGFGSRLPMVLQTEASECGLACLVMVTQYFGNAADLPDLRRRFGMSLKGATLKDVMRVAEQVGFAARPLRLELEELAQLRTPASCTGTSTISSSWRGSRAKRPSSTIRRSASAGMTMSELSRHFTGVALELMPTSKFETAEPAPRVKVSQLLGRVNGLRRSLLHLSGLALTIEIFAMLSPFFLGWVVDQALVSADRDLLLTLAIGFCPSAAASNGGNGAARMDADGHERLAEGAVARQPVLASDPPADLVLRGPAYRRRDVALRLAGNHPAGDHQRAGRGHPRRHDGRHHPSHHVRVCARPRLRRSVRRGALRRRCGGRRTGRCVMQRPKRSSGVRGATLIFSKPCAASAP